MSYFDCYDYPDYSALDELVDETINKIKNMIINQSKEKVDEILNKAQATQDLLNITNNRLIETNKENRSLKTENDKLKEELQQKRTNLDTLPFEIGQRVYYIRKWKTEEVVCPLCKGTGRIITHSDEYGDVEIKCPHCKNNSYWSERDKEIVRKALYDKLKVDSTTVKGFSIVIDSDEKGNIRQDIRVVLNEGYNFNDYNIENVFPEALLEECKKECCRRNKQYEEEAKRKVGIIKTE